MKKVKKAQSGPKTVKTSEISIDKGPPDMEPTEMDDEDAESLVAEANMEVESTLPQAPRISEEVQADLEEIEEQLVTSKPKPRESTVKDVIGMFDRGVMETPELNIQRNPARKKAIERRCAEMNDPLDLADLLTKGYLKQRVPIVESKLVVMFKTLRETEESALYEMATDYASGDNGKPPSQFAVDRFLFRAQLAAGILQINDTKFPSHMGRSDGEFKINLKVLNSRLKYLESLPKWLVTELGVQYSWFEERVKMLFLEEDLKNG